LLIAWKMWLIWNYFNWTFTIHHPVGAHHSFNTDHVPSWLWHLQTVIQYNVFQFVRFLRVAGKKKIKCKKYIHYCHSIRRGTLQHHLLRHYLNIIFFYITYYYMYILVGDVDKSCGTCRRGLFDIIYDLGALLKYVI